MAEIRLVELEVIKEFSLAVRQEFASAAALLAALDSDRARVLAALDAERSPEPLPGPRAKATPTKTAAKKTPATKTPKAVKKKAAKKKTVKKKAAGR